MPSERTRRMNISPQLQYRPLPAAQLSRKPPIEVLYITLRIVLAPVIDEPMIGHAWLIGELGPVGPINFCDPFADVRLSFYDQVVRWRNLKYCLHIARLVLVPHRALPS